MSRLIDLSGTKFGNSTAVERVENNKRGETMWKCKCDCGRTFITTCRNLRSGKTKSCGCLMRNNLINRNTTHGMTGHPLHDTWHGMLQRCGTPSAGGYSNYGARGISVCEEWKTFENFFCWATENGYSYGLQIDRINNNGNYEPSNCRWVTTKANSRNRRTNHMITVNGKTMCLIEAAEKYGVNYSTLKGRLSKGKSINEALGI